MEKFDEVRRDIEEAAKDGGYIFRGEPKCYSKVSSGVYRELKKHGIRDSDIDIFRKELLSSMLDYEESEAQHNRGVTPLIDWTEDYLVALLFACNKCYDDDGRVVILKRDIGDPRIHNPRNPKLRVIVQKSVMFWPERGFVEDDMKYVTIKKSLKKPILDHLKKYHAISEETVFPDLHGAIERQNTLKNSYVQYCLGKYAYADGDDASAEKHYNNAIEANPDDQIKRLAHYGLGLIFEKRLDPDRMLSAFNEVTSLPSYFGDAENLRQRAYYWKKAKDIKSKIEDCSDPHDLISLYTRYAVILWAQLPDYVGEDHRKPLLELALRHAEKATDLIKLHGNDPNSSSSNLAPTMVGLITEELLSIKESSEGDSTP